MKFHLMRKPSGSLIVPRNLGAQYEEIHDNFNAAIMCWWLMALNTGLPYRLAKPLAYRRLLSTVALAGV